MPNLTSSLVNLTSLTIYRFSGWDADVEKGLACLCSLKKLVDLDIMETSVPSGNQVNVTTGLPITGIKIKLIDPGHVSDVAGWLERCVPTSLRHLDLSITGFPKPNFEVQPSQVARMLSPLRSAGSQLKVLMLHYFDFSHSDSVNIITGLTQLTYFDLMGKFCDDGWALSKPAFAHMEGYGNRTGYGDGMSRFRAEAEPGAGDL